MAPCGLLTCGQVGVIEEEKIGRFKGDQEENGQHCENKIEDVQLWPSFEVVDQKCCVCGKEEEKLDVWRVVESDHPQRHQELVAQEKDRLELLEISLVFS